MVNGIFLLRVDGFAADELADINFDWNASPSPDPVNRRVIGDSWGSAIPVYDSRPQPVACPRNVVLYPDALSSLHAFQPVFGVLPRVNHTPPAPVGNIADFLDKRIAAKCASQLKKYKEMERLHTSEWFNLSSNKEADERGSRASVSVEGLRRSNNSPATTDLKHMLHIAQDHFIQLHTPHAMNTLRTTSHAHLLAEVAEEYGSKP